MATIPLIQPDLVLRHQFADWVFTYTERDVALYALGVGAPGSDPVDPLELSYVYHPRGQKFIKVLPTFAVVWPASVMDLLPQVEGMHFDEKLLLHGEQYMEIYKPFSTCCTVRTKTRISGLHDKGKAAILELECLSYDSETGDLLCLNRFTIFLRGAGGFSQSSKPFSYSKRTTNLKGAAPTLKVPEDSPPAAVYEDQTNSSQALLYRLSGDYNRLHSDPDVAAQAGFQRPILMGLCTLGYAVRAVVRTCCNGDSSRIQSLQCRFLSHVYPGEKLVTEMWVDPSHTKVTYLCKANGRKVLSGFVSMSPTPSRL